ncbi:MAG: hypothetical protein GX654_01235 [Desulfatiglans sp.]|jgi:hypothetical protein|nr:hypothetical protein [Desulfatiglans sp.]
MAIAYTEASQSFMVDSRFKTTAFICFFTAILGIPMFIFGMLTALKLSAIWMIFIRIPLTIVYSVFAIYILLQLERLLVKRYHLDNIRIMIKSIIIMLIILLAMEIFSTILPIFTRDQGALMLLGIVPYIPLCLLGGIIYFIYGVRLLELKDQTSGLYRIYAIMQIIGGVCFFTIILWFIGILFFNVALIVLGMIFLKESETEPEVEFV